ncbi:AIPR family protein [Glycomyces paridis]|uniref:Abortive phage infection protein C-terminal domain-containing protein n=1 Tax=Glycomyces paridis TaxID=2126555 RepID=A0A4S8PJU1_9ACTN|nr:AIPR family protein [Glycomyces paridis]THV30025.1 hypothetical protein E9998_06480 [Glycomyces paridis]
MNEVIQELLAEFKEARDLTDLDDAELFEAFAAHCVLHHFHEEDFDPEAHRTGGSQDRGVDAWGIVVNGELYHDLDSVRGAVEAAREMNVVVIVLQAKRSGSAEEKVVADLKDNLEQICSKEPMSYSASPRVVELHEALKVVFERHHRNAAGSPRLAVRYVHTGQEPNADLLAKCESARLTLEGLGRFDSATVEVVGFRQLQRLHQLANRKVRVEFDWPNKLSMPPMNGVQQAWMGTLPAKAFVRDLLVDEGGSLRTFLFEDNLRPFLGESNEVNDGIRTTLGEPVRKGRFAVLNNGITVIARSFNVSGQQCSMSDFQIVNGCQTGNVLFENRERLTDDVHVKVTVIEPRPDDVGVSGEITLATNRQTLIAKENLSADRTIHRDIEAYFLTTKGDRRLRYERRTGQFDADPSVTKTRVLKQSHLAQSYAAVFRGRAHEATRPAALLKDQRLTIFQPNDEPIVYYAAASVWYQMGWLLRNNRVDSRWKPARFLLMAAVVRRLAAGDLPTGPRQARKHCEALLDRVWERDEFERAVGEAVPHLERLLDADESGQRLNDLVRTRTFAVRFLEAVRPR